MYDKSDNHGNASYKSTFETYTDDHIQIRVSNFLLFWIYFLCDLT